MAKISIGVLVFNSCLFYHDRPSSCREEFLIRIRRSGLWATVRWISGGGLFWQLSWNLFFDNSLAQFRQNSLSLFVRWQEGGGKLGRWQMVKKGEGSNNHFFCGDVIFNGPIRKSLSVTVFRDFDPIDMEITS